MTLTKGGLLGQIVFQWVPSNFSLLLRVNKVVLFDDIFLGRVDFPGVIESVFFFTPE